MNSVQRLKFPLLLLLAVSIVVVLPNTALAQKKGKGKSKKADAEAAVDSEGASAPVIRSEFVCESNVFYSWSRIEEVPSEDGTPPTKRRLDPVEEFYVTVGQSGSDEIDTKNKLYARLPSAEAEALAHCRRRHQEASRCVAAHLRQISDEYQKMDFASRRAMLDTITGDCREQSGACTETRSSEIACYENAISGISPAGAGEGAEAAADEKKGKSKKKK